MSYSITKLVGPLSESKAYGSLTRKKIDLRALEARAYAIVHKREYPKIVARQAELAGRQLAGVKRKLRTALMREVKSWKREDTSYATLLRRSQSFIESSYREAYLQGLRSQGHGALRGVRGTKLSPTDKLTPEDLAWIRSAAAEEMKYWTRFMKSMSPRDGEEDTETSEGLTKQQQRRLDMYIATVDSVFDAGKVQGAPDWVIVDWVLGVAEHCPECLYLSKHSPYTKESLPCTPRSGCTRCLSNCKCRLVLTPVDPKMYSKINRRVKGASHHLRQLERSRRLSRGLPEVASMLLREEVNDRVQKATAVSRQSGDAQRHRRRRR